MWTYYRLPVTGGIRRAVKCVEAAEQLFTAQLDAIFSLRVKRGGSVICWLGPAALSLMQLQWRWCLGLP
jgi:hypothetical protein